MIKHCCVSDTSGLSFSVIFSTFMAFGRHPFLRYLHFFIYITEQLRDKGLAQGPSSGSLAVLGFDLTNF